jgi:hypothetical protein
MGLPGENVCGIAACTCGCTVFKLKIYTCGNTVEHCAGCDRPWKAPPWHPWHDTYPHEALAGGGDESIDVVSKA